MNTELKERASELARGYEIDGHKYTAETIRKLLNKIERLRGIEKQAHEEGVITGKQIAWLEFEIERLEEELKEQKRAAWNHEGVSKDYTLAIQKVKSQGEQIDALTRQRDILADYVRERADRCGHCDNCWSRCYINQAKQTLVAAGMEGKNDTRRTTEILQHGGEA